MINKDIENAVIGAILIDKNLFEKAIEKNITEIDFLNKTNRKLYKLFEENIFDLNIIKTKLNEKEKMELFDILESVQTVSHFDIYLKELKENSKKRKLLNIIENTKEDLKTEEFERLKNNILYELEKIDIKNEENKEYNTKNIYHDFFKDLEKNIDKAMNFGFEGFPDVHIEGGDTFIIAGRPATGKTAFALNVGIRLSKQGHKGLFFSLEMSAKQIGRRLMSILTDVELSKIKTKEGMAKLTDEDYKKISLFSKELEKINLDIIDTSNANIENIKQIARRYKRTKNIDFIIVDYLQLVRVPKSNSRFEEVSEVSLQLKALARELNIPIFALAQLSRGIEHRADKKPTMADLRDSGQIEQDASIIAFLYKDETKQDAIIEGRRIKYIELSIAKNRNGELYNDTLAFEGSKQKFYEPKR